MADLTINERLEEMRRSGSKTNRAIATYLLNNIDGLPFETASSLADKTKVSGASVSRFCRQLGYENIRDLKDHLRSEVGYRPWLDQRQLDDLRERSGAVEERLNQALELEIAGIVKIYEQPRRADWHPLMERLASVPTVFVIGFQTDRGLASYFAHQLQYLRDGVRVIDLAAGNFAEVLAHSGEACLVMFEGRRYSRLAKVLAEDASAAGIPVTLMTDQFCDWGQHCAREIFAVDTQLGQFWDSTAHLAILTNLMLNDIFLVLGKEADARLQKTAETYARYTGHVGTPTGRIST